MRILRSVAVSALALLAFACSTTRITSAWHNPEAKPVAYTKVLALALTDQSSNRRVMEDALAKDVAAVGQAQAVASYTVLADADVKDEAKIRAAIAKVGADGLVVMRVVGTEKELVYVPGTVHTAPVIQRTWWGYYRTIMPVSVTPGHTRTHEKVRIETMVFTVANEMLVWAGMSETMNPDSVAELTKGVADAVVEDMRQGGLIR